MNWQRPSNSCTIGRDMHSQGCSREMRERRVSTVRPLMPHLGSSIGRCTGPRACAGVGQIFTSANNAMGHGAASPNRVDLPAHRNLCDAAIQHGVRRLVYVSGRGSGGEESPVDFFRVKSRIEELVRESGVPYVLFSPTMLMETWVA